MDNNENFEIDENTQLNNENEVVLPKKRKVLPVVINVILVLLIIILAFRLFFNLTYTGIYVVGSSMMPTITGAAEEGVEGGDYLFINKNATPDYGDIVVKIIIKRVIALAGDSLYLNDGDLFVKYAGTTEYIFVEENYLDENNNKNDLRNTFSPVDVGENQMFLMGDNRDNSKDSRDYGCFSTESLYGVVADWSLSLKETISTTYNFFKFDLNFNI